MESGNELSQDDDNILQLHLDRGELNDYCALDDIFISISGYNRYVDESDTESESDDIASDEDRYVKEAKFQLKDPLLAACKTCLDPEEDLLLHKLQIKEKTLDEEGELPQKRGNSMGQTQHESKNRCHLTQIYTQRGKKTVCSTPCDETPPTKKAESASEKQPRDKEEKVGTFSLKEKESALATGGFIAQYF